jgi:drug/metabolite transporter (DMT)-like permease
MTGAVLAVLASLCYGSSDIVAGVAARRVTPIAVALWGHGIGTAVVVAVTVVVAGRPTWGAFGPGVLAGGVAGLGLLLYYGALRRGQVSVVTPLAATGVAVPVLVGAVTGEVPGLVGWVGLVIAAVGVLTLARTRSAGDEPAPPCPGARPGCPDEQGARSPRLSPAVAALLAALSFGAAFVLIDVGASAGSPLWVAAGLQIGGLTGLLPVAVSGSLRRLRVPGRALTGVLGAGLLAAAGDVALAQAFPRGSLPVVSVLGSLDSVVSVLLAQLVLRERLRLLQTAGITGALVGALLLAAS